MLEERGIREEERREGRREGGRERKREEEVSDGLCWLM